MANNDDLILRGNALRDLRGIKDVLETQGDPFLANILNRAIDCIENQPAQKPIDAMLTLAAKYEAALKDLAQIKACEHCKRYETSACYRCEVGSEWVWRGSSVG